ncbi:hypothetical protein [Engelhardtia mirabilis]|uniref:Uncharacterized protein n=1 Tax=Engelhardtia mirabilis TaxID=2528011 RepID=A0A518BDW1_9BACT|nr:hypothetical protein Pla133_01360 [Planctomycetes bacterium Pla133]QDU99399.1 hypothetical protein Pla86_01360 [Planctomycetes bacterium Pla86]
MRFLFTVLFPAVASVALASDLHFAPAEGLELVKTFNEATTWTLDEVTQFVGGEETPVQGLDGFDCDFERNFEFVDSFGAMVDGELRGLRREVRAAFVSADMEMVSPLGTLPLEFAATSDLVGETIVFRNDDEADEMVVELASGEVPSSLEGVDIDADLRALLPDAGAELGDSWVVDNDRLGSLFMPGGDLALLPDSIPELPGGGGMESTDLVASAQLALAFPWRVTEGTAEAEWTGTTEEDGHELITIKLEFDLELAADRTELVRAMCESNGLETDREDLLIEMAWTLEGQGELVWDATAGHFASLQVDLDGKGQVNLTWGEPIGGGQTIEVRVRADVTTETELTATAQTRG